MVEPTNFYFDKQTAGDNEFMHDQEISTEKLTKEVKEEHQGLVKEIESNGITVMKYFQMEDDLPNSLFPNNWISTHKCEGIIEDRLVCVYPMEWENRQREVNKKMIEDLKNGDGEVIDMTDYVKKEKYLEGTGALVFDMANLKIYANVSGRCADEPLHEFVENFNSKTKKPFKLVKFDAKNPDGTSIYHTNVMMSIVGDHWIVSLDSLVDEDEKNKVIEELTSTETNEFPKKIIDISREELEHMCGNVIGLVNSEGKPCVVMSSTAYNGYTKEHFDELKSHYKMIHSDCSKIENIGGGSARCMIAEIF